MQYFGLRFTFSPVSRQKLASTFSTASPVQPSIATELIFAASFSRSGCWCPASPSSTATSRPTWTTASKPSSATANDQLRPHYRRPLVVIPEGNLLLCRQFRWRRIVVLLAPHVAVVHDRALEQLVPPIVELPPMLAQLSHLLLPQRLEVMQNRKILIQHRHRVHTRYGRRNARHAHRIRQRLRRGQHAMHNRLAGAAHALHREHGHLLRHRNRQHVLLKRPEAWIERIHRKLHR